MTTDLPEAGRRPDDPTLPAGTTATPGAAADEATALLGAGRPQEALDVLDRALLELPDDPVLLTVVAVALDALDEAEQAERVVLLALAQRETAPALRLLSALSVRRGDSATAWNAAVRAAEIAPDDRSAHAAVASAAVVAGYPIDVAIRAARAAVQLGSDDPESWVLLGDVLTVAHHTEEAAAAYASALEVDPTSATARERLGEAQLAAGKPGEAAAHFVDLLQERPDAWDERHDLLVALHTATSQMSRPLSAALAVGIVALVWSPRFGLDPAVGGVVASVADAGAVAAAVVVNVRFLRAARGRLRPIIRVLRRQGVQILNRWEALVLATLAAAVAVVVPGGAKVFPTLVMLFLLLLALASRSRAEAELSGRVLNATGKRALRRARRQRARR